MPFHAVGEGNIDVRMIRQVNGVFVRAGNVNANDIITVVRDIEIQMGVDEMVALRFPEKQVVLKVANVIPYGRSSKYSKYSSSTAFRKCQLGRCSKSFGRVHASRRCRDSLFRIGFQLLVPSKNFAKTVPCGLGRRRRSKAVKVLVYLVRVIAGLLCSRKRLRRRGACTISPLPERRLPWR